MSSSLKPCHSAINHFPVTKFNNIHSQGSGFPCLQSLLHPFTPSLLYSFTNPQLQNLHPALSLLSISPISSITQLYIMHSKSSRSITQPCASSILPVSGLGLTSCRHKSNWGLKPLYLCQRKDYLKCSAYGQIYSQSVIYNMFRRICCSPKSIRINIIAIYIIIHCNEGEVQYIKV